MLNATIRRAVLHVHMRWLAYRVRSAITEMHQMAETADWLVEQSSQHQRVIRGWVDRLASMRDEAQLLDQRINGHTWQAQAADTAPHEVNRHV